MYISLPPDTQNTLFGLISHNLGSDAPSAPTSYKSVSVMETIQMLRIVCIVSPPSFSSSYTLSTGEEEMLIG